MTLRDIINDYPKLKKQIACLKASNNTTGSGEFIPDIVVNNYNELLTVTGQLLFEFAQVLNSQGTPYLPGSLGGTYYSSGLYYWNGVNWINDDSAIYEALQNITIVLNNHTHVKADITDFNDADYATAAQGILASTAIQPGDLAFVAISGDYEDLINKPILDVINYRSDFEITDDYVYSGFTRNGIDIVKRCKDNTNEFAQGVTDLETDWTNRLSLTYL